MQSLIHIDKDAFNHMTDNIQDLSTNVKIIQKDIDQFHKLFDKMDATNEKMDTTNANLQSLIFEVQRVVAIHEQKLEAQGDYSNYLDKKIDHHITDNVDSYDKIEKKNTALDERIQKLEKVKWVLVGVFSAISLAVQLLLQFFK